MMPSTRICLAIAALALSLLSGCKIENRGTGSQDALAAAPADNAVTAMEGGLKAADREAIQCHLDIASGKPVTGAIVLPRGQGAAFEGWAFEQGQPTLAKALLVFSGIAGTYRAEVKGGTARPDVAKSFDSKDLGNAGFTAVVDITNLPAGSYSLWLATGEQEGDKACDLKASVELEG